jgi:putative ABC transport system ATP-binding protein/macrolide transport system ATP-binding/permease protein/lipoprotein-releasing system ATP-binding protein
VLLEARGLRKVYASLRGEIDAVDGIDLEVRNGEFLAVCGRSGSGKSTLLAMLGGLCRPTAGTVRLDGVDLWSLQRGGLADFRAQRLGFLFQFTGLLPNLRAADNVALPALLAGSSYQEAYERARQLLAEVRLADRWDAYPGELSGGEQRRVALARALSNRPVLLLADEPTNDLDEESERDVLALLRELPRAQGTTLLVATHDPLLAAQADRVIRLHAGKLVWVGSPEPAAGSAPVTPAPAEPVAPRAPLAEVPPTPLGAGLGQFVATFLGWTLLVACGLWGIDYATARFQRRSIEARQAERKRSEELALQKLRAGLDDISYRPDGGYEAAVFLQNFDPSKPFHVLGPAVRVFVQVNRAWQEVPATAVGHTEGGVREVTGKVAFRFAFRADLARFDELLPGYLHVRVTNVMVVSEHAEPTDDLFQRTDDYYAYLKPQKVSDDEVRARNGWKPGGLVPRWIGMPAH